MPLRKAAFLAGCGQMEPKSKDLTVFVRQWDKDRGICQATMGRVSPNAKTRLCIYFGEVGIPGMRLHLPICEFKAASSLGLKKSPPMCVRVEKTGLKAVIRYKLDDLKTLIARLGSAGLQRSLPRGGRS